MKLKNLVNIFSLNLFLMLSQSTLAGWLTTSFQGSDVHIHLPPSLELEGHLKEVPLMVALHGCAQTSQIMKDFGNWSSASEEYETIVVIPSVPNGGVIAGCWDYYGTDHTRSNRHNGFIFELVDFLKSKYQIDDRKVFISGLSSGGGLSMVMACLAPDIFSGVGINAGPSVGTGSGEIGRATISVSDVVKNCEALAGANASSFDTQVVSFIYGDNDFLVDPNYNKKNAEAFSEIYGAITSENFDLTKLAGTRSEGQGTYYLKNQKPVISIIQNTGLGHAWPAGDGGFSRSFIQKNSVDYPRYLLNFLISNNRRL